MAHKKAAGSSKNGRDSRSKRLGVKLYAGQSAKAGSIIIRQRGTRVYPGDNVKVGKDYTLFSLINGVVSFTEKKFLKFNGRVYKNKVVHVTAI